MDAVFYICGGLAVIYLLTQLPRGGWKRVLPLLIWFAVTLPLAVAISSEAGRIVTLVAIFAGALLLREWAARRFPRTS